ncbi:MAG: LptA/OstA family protein [Alphaproteobacteria bacterium]
MAFLATMFAAEAKAQNLGFAASTGGAIQIEATDGVEWDRTKKSISALGNAVVTQGKLKLTSSVIEAYYHNNDKPEVFKFAAKDNIVFISPEVKISGDEAEYNIETGIITVTGNPAKLERHKETLTAYEKLEYNQNEKKAIAKGNATIVSDGKKLVASTIEAYFVNNKEKNVLELKNAKTIGKVEINTANEKITADNGIYDAKKSIATLDGNVIISQQENQLRGDKAEVNLQTGISRLTSNAQGKQRVKGTFVKE